MDTTRRTGGAQAPPSGALAHVRACMQAAGEALDKAAAFGFADADELARAAGSRDGGFRRYQDFDYVAHRVEEAASELSVIAADDAALTRVAASLPGGVARVRRMVALAGGLDPGDPGALHRALWEDCRDLLAALYAAERSLVEDAARTPVRWEQPRRGRRPQPQEGDAQGS